MSSTLMLNWKKILASFIATAFFLFFWINGPINQQISAISSDHSLSEYAIAKLVGEKKETKSSNLLSNSTVKKNSTNGLLGKQSSIVNTSGLLSSKVSNRALNERSQQLKEHTKNLLKLKSNEIEIIDNYAITSSEIYFESSPHHDHIMGYAGPITIGLELTLDNSIKNIHIIASHETESYMRKIQRSGYFQQFSYLTIDKGHSQIDGVSGATITSQAIGKIVEGMVEEVAMNQSSYASTGSEAFSLKVENSLVWVLHITLILTLFIYGYQSKYKRSKRSMLILGFLSVLYIGFFLNNSFTYISFIEPFVGSTLSMFTGLYAFAALVSAIWGSNTYCKYVCPFGHAQRLFIKVPFIKHYKLPISNKWVDRVRNTLTIALISGVFLGLRQWKNYEIFPSLFGLEIISFSFLIAFLTLLISAVYPMFWCRVACPTGCVLDNVKKITK